MAVIYKITNPKGKIYIGSTINFERRMCEYKSGGNTSQIKLYNSLKKYNFDEHITEIICVCPDEERYIWENYYGTIYDVLLPENLNLALPKIGDKVPCISEETRKKMSNATKGEKNPMYGKPVSEEKKLKISESLKGRSSSRKGKHHTEESKQKMRASAKERVGEKSPMYGSHHSKESKRKISVAAKERVGEKSPMYGSHHSEETKIKISNQLKGRNHTEETKQKMSNLAKGRNHTEETKQKMSINNGTSKKIINTETNVIYNSIIDASKQTNYCWRYLSNMIHNKILNKTPFMLLSDWDKSNS